MNVSLETEDQKTLYALGLAIAQNLGNFNLSTDELAIVQSAIEDSVMKRDPQVDLQEYGPKIQAFAQAKASAAADVEKAAGATFLTEQAAMDGAVKKDSGLIISEITAGTGDSPTAADTVSVHYHGTLRDGTVFDSSVDRGQPATFPLGGVIPCWTEGLQLMKVGGKSRLVCPSDIAYGDQGRPPVIPPGAVLIFEVELLSIGEAAAS
ncbi:MAG: FKBP-type peptidyl-prolyl cis-trans isomerase [Deltaproteobacteria bacterium]|nr:FKBP-type peptidyl-prolyl cis-trans isomerase [Deltaproteobacteria bacterium]